MSKVISPANVLKDIQTGDTFLVRKFRLSGTPLTFLNEITQSSVKELTENSNNLVKKVKD